MRVINQSQWLNFQNVYPDGDLVIEYAVRWASRMEKELRKRKQKPKKIRLIAEDAYRQVGVATFALTYSVFILEKFWVHGRELKMWHEENK